jgi:hypothetical protein
MVNRSLAIDDNGGRALNQALMDFPGGIHRDGLNLIAIVHQRFDHALHHDLAAIVGDSCSVV